MKCCYNQCRGNPGCYREEQRNSPETVALREKIALRQDRPRNDKASAPDRRLRWTDHIDAAIVDLRNSDRSPFEQRVYDMLRRSFGNRE